MLHEVTEAGNGKWLKGLTITVSVLLDSFLILTRTDLCVKGDNKDKVKLPISEMGWDKTRTGNPGERPIVWLYITKD